MSAAHSKAEPLADRDRVLDAIAQELELPIDEVAAAYRQELTRLIARARIQRFVPTLAIRNTRKLLRHRGASGAARGP
jgi:uncharacterized protein (DUF2126 family)